MHATHNTLSENIRSRSVEVLNRHLAAAIDLHAQMKQAHWNVRGPNFIALHGLFDKCAEEAEAYSDLIAERARGLGGEAEGTVQRASQLSSSSRSFSAATAFHRPRVAAARRLGSESTSGCCRQ